MTETPLRLRVGRTLHRWRPWPSVAILGIGGVLLIMDSLFWQTPGDRFRYWLGLCLGAVALLLAALEVWIVLDDRVGTLGE